MFNKIINSSKVPFFFKSVAVFNLVCLIINLIFHNFLSQHTLITRFINYSSSATLLIMIGIISLKGILLFLDEHKKMNSGIKIIKETIITVLTIFFIVLIFLDEEIEEKIILFINNSTNNINNPMTMITVGIVMLIFTKGIYDISTMPNKKIDANYVKDEISTHFKRLAIKIITLSCIIFGSLHILGLQKLSVQILNYTEKILQASLIVAIGMITLLWIIRGRSYLKTLK